MKRNTYALVAAAMAVGLVASAQTTAAAAPIDSAQLAALIPAPENSTLTRGPDTIADNGIHMHFQVNGAPAEVMNAYRAAADGKGWAMTTIVTSGGAGGGGATYTGTQGEAWSVFDGGGFDTTTYIDVCAWPTKPANPNCTRGDR